MRVEATAGAPALVAEFELPDGSALTLGESAESEEGARRAQEDVQQAANKRRRAKSRKPDDDAPATEPELPLSADNSD